jgi:hypothetical protein
VDNDLKERYRLQTDERKQSSFPTPTTWGIHADIAGRPTIWGTFQINSNKDGRINGTINFRGANIPVTGNWNENNKEIQFNSPYATFSGTLNIFDDTTIRIRHYLLSGQFIMKPPSIQAGEYGTWIATTDTDLTGPPISNGNLPPVGVFLTSDFLNDSFNERNRTF